MAGQHALLSPSAAHRWLHCTPAPRLEADAPDAPSAYAEEGTLAHAIGARKLKEFMKQPTDDERAEIEQLSERYYSGEMEEYTDTYASIVLEKLTAARTTTPDAELLVESRLDFGDFVPDAFGTADALIIADGLMEVVDLKYGKGVKVDAADNAQMMIYGLGAYLAHNYAYLIERLRLTIVQPRIDNISEFEISVADLLAWAESTLRPLAAKAFRGEGEQTPGDWCRFCKVKGNCRALAKQCADAVDAHTDVRLIDKATMERDILPRLEMMKSWLSSIEEYALAQALAGVEYTGYKLVEGRSIRRITDPDAVRRSLMGLGLSEADIMKPAELRGLSDLEKLVGKKQFAAACADYIIKPQGKPTLVVASDKRPVYNGGNDFDNFN